MEHAFFVNRRRLRLLSWGLAPSWLQKDEARIALWLLNR